ncbi:MAG TPA: ABC transporter substrate-binding protein [Hyphomicrobiaceae bacterium]|nr:ABC transporter substrate-binding protein [Hyphomicrobiaceae bacterium]
MRKLSKLAAGALLAGALAAPAVAEDGVTDTEILIGSHTALSGPVSAWGIGSTEGARMRYDEANAKGGIYGRKIRLIVEDHGYAVPRAVQAANKLINNDKIFIMHGALGTPHNNAAFAEQFAKGVPNLFPFTAARSMVEPFHPLKFQTLSSYYDQIRAATKYFVEKGGKKKVCTMYMDTDFGHEIRDGVRDEAKASKFEIAAEATFGPTDTDFTGQVGKLKAAGCDLVAMGSIIKETIQTIATARKGGWKDVTFVGQAASYDPIVARAPGGITEGFYSGTGQPFAYPDSSPEVKAWSDKFKAKTGRDANTAAQYGYGGADIIVKALEAAGKDLTRARFLAALEAIKDLKPAIFPGPTVTFGPKKHQGSNATYLAKVEGGRWKVVAENLTY